ncbi:hypothetical protein ACVBEJ_13915 [Porticoccus sp. GXU_MW_L64]
MFYKVGHLSAYLIALMFTFSPAVIAQDWVTELETAIKNEGFFELIHQPDNLPADIQELLPIRPPTFTMAAYGEDWSSGCVIREGVPSSQLQFAGITNKLAVVVFHTGGISGQTTQIILKERESNLYCRYRPVKLQSVASIKRVQEYLGRKDILQCMAWRFDGKRWMPDQSK